MTEILREVDGGPPTVGTPYYSSALVVQALRGFGHAGYATGELERELGVRLRASLTFGGITEADKVHEMWQRIMTELRVPGLPAKASTLPHPEVTGLNAFLRASCPNLRVALRMFIAGQRLVSDACSWHAVETDGEHRLVMSSAYGGLGARCMHEFMLCSLVHSVSLLTRGNCRPIQSFFSHSHPGDISEHEQVLGHVTFGAPTTGFVFDDKILDAPLNAFGHSTATAAFVNLVGLQAEVVRIAMFEIKRGLLPSMGDVARRVSMSGRTLQRRLTERGVSFQGLLDYAKKHLALELLSEDGTASIKEVSNQLGFQSSAAFTRAFKRWTGVSPRRWRAQRRGADSPVG